MTRAGIKAVYKLIVFAVATKRTQFFVMEEDKYPETKAMRVFFTNHKQTKLKLVLFSVKRASVFYIESMDLPIKLFKLGA